MGVIYHHNMLTNPKNSEYSTTKMHLILFYTSLGIVSQLCFVLELHMEIYIFRNADLIGLSWNPGLN